MAENTEIEDLRNRVKKLEESNNLLSEKYDNVVKRLDEIEKAGKIEIKPNKNIYKPIRFKNAL